MVSKLFRTTVKQTTPLIIVFSLIQLVAGIPLGDLTNNMSALPGILILLPPLLAMRGNIGSSLGARLSSGLHLGYIRPDKITKDLKANIYSALIMSLLMSIVLAIFISIACVITASVCLSIVPLTILTIGVGFTSGFILVFVGVVISEFSYKKGLDPDNITAPTITTAGDVITIMVFIMFVRIFLIFGIV